MMPKPFPSLLIPILLAAALLLGTFTFLPFSAQAVEPTAAALPAAPVDIVYWHHNTGDGDAYINELVDEFNNTNPYSITVTAEYAGSYGTISDRVIDGLQNEGELPNVVVAYPNSFAEFARYGGVRFLDDYFNDPTIGITDTTDYFSGVLDYYRLGEYGDQLAGIQNGRSILVMYYNADLLAAEGLSVPETWDEFETACIRMTSETVSGTVLGSGASLFANWLWSHGGTLLADDLNTARFDEKPGIDSLVLLQDLIQAGYARTLLTTYEDQESFVNGQTGFTFGSSKGIPYYRRDMEAEAQDAWGVARAPALVGHEVVNSYGAGQGVIHHNEDEDLASWMFIKWLTQREQTARWAAVSGYFPVRTSATSHISMTEKLAGDPQYTQAFNLLDLGRGEPTNRGYNAIRGIIGDAVEDVLQNGANVTDTLNTAADQADAVLAASGPDSALIPPTGGTLTYTNTESFSATVEFPAGALVVTETISYVPLDDLPSDGLAFALVPNLVFSQPVTITLHYRDEDIAGMDEAALVLYNYDWSLNAWVDAEPCGGYQRDPVQNILQAGVCHFSDYSLMDYPYHIFLPQVIR